MRFLLLISLCILFVSSCSTIKKEIIDMTFKKQLGDVTGTTLRSGHYDCSRIKNTCPAERYRQWNDNDGVLWCSCDKA